MNPAATVVSLRAPLPYGFGGYRWFDLAFPNGQVEYAVEEGLASIELIAAKLKALQSELDYKPEQTFLGGFSQGAVMTLGVASAYPELVSRAFMMSGALLPELVSPTTESLKKVSFFVQHGKLDPVLPIVLGRAVRDYLQEEGLDLTYKEYGFAHEISQESLMDLLKWLGAGFLNDME